MIRLRQLLRVRGGLGIAIFAALVAGAAPVLSSAAKSSASTVWVHYDYMVGPGYSDAPSPAAIQMVVDAFAAHGVTLHIDPQHTAIPAHRVIVPDWQSQYASLPGFDDPSCTGPDAVRFSDLKNQYFHPNSNHPWHYAVFGDYVFGDPHVSPDGQPYTSHCPTPPNGEKPQPGQTGDSQVGFDDVPGSLGYDFVVAMQPFRDVGRDVNDPANARFVAGTFMHELGHNLGLCHTGPPLGLFSCSQGNFKPNYISVMNYDFQFGIPFAATLGSTTIAGWRVDYSDVKLPDLDERGCLDETLGLQDSAHPTDISFIRGVDRLIPAVGPVDWTGNGTIDTCVGNIDLNQDGILTPLDGADDWAWIDSCLAPPTITNVSVGVGPSAGTIFVNGTNLFQPTTVIFAGGAQVTDDSDTNNFFCAPEAPTRQVPIPAGAKNGPITVVTPEGKTTSSQSLTITP